MDITVFFLQRSLETSFFLIEKNKNKIKFSYAAVAWQIVLKYRVLCLYRRWDVVD